MFPLAAFIGLALLAATILASRLIMERAFRALPADQKLAITESESPTFRALGALPLMLLVGLLVFLPSMPTGQARLAFCIILALALGYRLWHERFVLLRRRRLGLPAGYFRARMWAACLSICGLSAVFLAFGYLLLV